MIVRYTEAKSIGKRRCTRSGILVHRCGVDKQTGRVLGLTGPDLAAAFCGGVPEAACAVGCSMPYTFVIGGPTDEHASNGVIWQCLPLDAIGWHARSASTQYIGVGVIGDFRYAAPTTAQFDSLVDLCSDLAVALAFPATRIMGHGEVRAAHDGTKAPGQPGECPGKHLDMNLLRHDIGDRIGSDAVGEARKRLEAAGVRL